jgi:hypothetical protein
VRLESRSSRLALGIPLIGSSMRQRDDGRNHTQVCLSVSRLESSYSRG